MEKQSNSENPFACEATGKPDCFALYLVASRSNCPEELLVCFAASRNTRLRVRVAENPNCPVWLLMKLARDSDPVVRTTVAEHRQTPPAVLELLAQDLCADVRYGLAENPHLPASILAYLCDDLNPYIACRAHKTLQVLSRERQDFLNVWRELQVPESAQAV